MQPLDADDLVGRGERAVVVAPVEVALPDRVVRDVVVELRRVGVGGVLRVDDDVERLVLDLDQLGGVARQLARRRRRRPDRLADVAHLADRERVVLDVPPGSGAIWKNGSVSSATSSPVSVP